MWGPDAFGPAGCLIAVAIVSWMVLSCTWERLQLSASKRHEVLRGRVVLVTGGGSGIGAATCRQLARAGAVVVIWDVQLDAAQAVVRDIAAHGGCAHAWAVDVTDRQSVSKAATSLRKDLKAEVFALVNNAGIVSGARLLELRPEQIERTMGVNVLAHFWTLQEFLPAMLRGACETSCANGRSTRDSDRGGHIVTVASTMSFSAASGLSDYVASKHAVWGMHECLRLELAQLHAQGNARVDCECIASYARAWAPICLHSVLSKNSLHVFPRAGTIICPFATATGMFDGIGFPWWSRLFLPILDAEYVAAQVVDAIVANRPVVIMPWLLRWLPFVLRALLPVLWLDRCANMLGATTAMDSFVGHSNAPTREACSRDDRLARRARSPRRRVHCKTNE